MSTSDLHPYQVSVIGECAKRFAAAARRIMLVAPTGSGKTTCAA
jgi:superfamily II DNA or RNA helicase